MVKVSESCFLTSLKINIPKGKVWVPFLLQTSLREWGSQALLGKCGPFFFVVGGPHVTCLWVLPGRWEAQLFPGRYPLFPNSSFQIGALDLGHAALELRRAEAADSWEEACRLNQPLAPAFAATACATLLGVGRGALRLR